MGSGRRFTRSVARIRHRLRGLLHHVLLLDSEHCSKWVVYCSSLCSPRWFVVSSSNFDFVGRQRRIGSFA
jgi:hypothetical protein